MSTTYSESVFICAACKEHAPYNIVICGVCGCTIFSPHCLMNGTIFGKKLLNIKGVFVDFFYNYGLKHFSS
jgi:hypothetical protein